MARCRSTIDPDALKRTPRTGEVGTSVDLVGWDKSLGPRPRLDEPIGGAMNPFPTDIFTEPTSVDPDTLANLGPLSRLAGTWEAPKGMDINPKAAGPEHRQFIEHIDFQPIDPQTNGPQLLYGMRYHIHINTAEEDITFHEQVGYWLWEPATGLVMQTLAIPRGQVALASGHASPGDNRLRLTAERGQTEYGICSTAFLEYAFRTDRYQIEITFNPDGTWNYVIETTLTVHGESTPFIHRDQNTLKKIGEPIANPLLQIARARAQHIPSPAPVT
jgi:hypothetical protein